MADEAGTEPLAEEEPDAVGEGGEDEAAAKEKVRLVGLLSNTTSSV
jgi:hypothetical protein